MLFGRFGEGGKGVGDEITQQTLLPEVRDPNLWIVKCRIGEEKVSPVFILSLIDKTIT
jgi:transcription elongation factor SPT5